SRGATLDESAARREMYALKVTNSSGNYSLASGEPAVRYSQSVNQTEAPVRSQSLSLAPGGAMGGGGGAAPSTGARSFAFGDEFRNGDAGQLNRQKFVQWTEDAKRVASLSNAVPVLTNFAVEQNGGQLRVVDSDGSVYDGYLNWVLEPATAL